MVEITVCAKVAEAIEEMSANKHIAGRYLRKIAPFPKNKSYLPA